MSDYLVFLLQLPTGCDCEEKCIDFSKGAQNKYSKNIENFGMKFPNNAVFGSDKVKIGALTATMCCPE